MSRLVSPNEGDFRSFRERVLQGWQHLSDLTDGSYVLLVTHGGVLWVRLEIGDSRNSASLVFRNTIS